MIPDTLDAIRLPRNLPDCQPAMPGVGVRAAARTESGVDTRSEAH